MLECWPYIQNKLAAPVDFELPVPETLTNNIKKQQSEGKAAYTKLIQNLSQEGKQAGKKWLKSISENVWNIFAAEIKKEK